MAEPSRPGGPDLTIDEFAAWADPPFRSRRQLADLITALAIPSSGTRPRPVGRPALTYPAAVLMRLHAGVAEWLPVPEPGESPESGG